MNKTPKLRFKEFSGDWESKKLGTMGAFFKGSTLSKAHLSEDGNPCVLYGELYTKYGEVIKNVISKTNLDDSKLVIGQKNDVLIPSSGETAIDIATASCLQQDNVILGGDLNVFRSNELNGIFASYQLNNSKRHEIAKLAQGASVVHVYNTQLSKLKLSVPSKEEQEKIASFFSLIDDKISLQGEKVYALKDYKNGMMQKIFSRKLRFKDDDGRDYPEWEEKKLGDICTFFSGGTPLTSKNSYYNGDIPFIRSAEISGEKTELTISEEGLNNSSAKMVQKGDLLYALYGATSGEVSISKIDGAINQAILCIKSNNVELSFIEKILRRNKETIIGTYLQGGQGNLSANIIKGLKYLIPHLDEQKKISNFLDHLDTKIEKEQEKLDSLNEYKKGLLQQIFV
ncbi:MAG: restriction endonuclease subunit S [Paraclostridium sp.]